jgi:hypothetical protein
MAKRLWNIFDGEPFLDNPHLGLALLNRAKKGKKMALRRRKKTYRRRGRKMTARRVKRSRRNPYPMAGVVVNPRRRKRGRRHVSRRKRSMRRNPAVLGVSIPPLNKVIFAGVGFIAPPMVEGFLSQFLPATLTGNVLGRYATRILSVIGLSWATRQFVGREEGNMVAIGGSVYVLSTAIQEFAPGIIPGLGMYVAPRSSLRAYVPPTGPNQQAFGNVVGLPAQQLPSRFSRLTR